MILIEILANNEQNDFEYSQCIILYSTVSKYFILSIFFYNLNHVLPKLMCLGKYIINKSTN